jgi:hypothetical protein
LTITANGTGVAVGVGTGVSVAGTPGVTAVEGEGPTPAVGVLVFMPQAANSRQPAASKVERMIFDLIFKFTINFIWVRDLLHQVLNPEVFILSEFSQLFAHSNSLA